MRRDSLERIRNIERLHDILDAATEAIELAPADRDLFMSNRKDQLSLFKLVERISEAAYHVHPDIRVISPEIPWRNIIGMRNRTTHGYFEVDYDTVWRVVVDQLPLLVPHIKAIIRAY